MKTNYENLILEKLLDRYEKSAHYRQTATANRRVMLRLGPSSRDFQEYVIESLEIRLAINQAVLNLTAAGLVKFEWERYQQNNVLATVWLQLDRVQEAYQMLDRTPAAEIVQAILTQIEKLLTVLSVAGTGGSLATLNREWVVPALIDIQARVSTSRKLAPLLPEDAVLAHDLLIALEKICSDGFVETSLRVFSSQCFRNSKYFEQNLRGRLLSLLRRYHPLLCSQEPDSNPVDDDLLILTGLFRNPEIFEFCGPLCLIFKKENGEANLDMGVFSAGACLNSNNLNHLLMIDSSRIRRFLLIENRTSYEVYLRKERQPDELVFYHGGFHSLAKQRFLNLVVKSLPACIPVLHWGDIDLGGLRILVQIRSNVAPCLQPWRMDRQTLLACQERAMPISPDYRQAVEKALTDPLLADYRDVLQAMLEMGLRLEQENLVDF